jgi:hypothetical protein
MSRTFLKYFKPFIKSFINIDSNNDNINKFVIKTITIISTISTVSHCAYALGSVENKYIKIVKKYQFDRNGFTEFMIICDNGEHYNVTNSLWFWKWDSIEDWHNLELNKLIMVKYYGWRYPLFGMFPNIIASKQYY